MNLQIDFSREAEVQPMLLIGSKNCPYVQRVVMLGIIAGIDLKTQYLEDSPDIAIKTISPTGKVPVMKTGTSTLFESNVILEYVNETLELHLLPSGAVDKAYCRAWIAYSNDLLTAQSRLFDSTENEWRSHLQKYGALMTTLENALDHSIFSSEEFSLVDIAFAPLFKRMDIISRLLGEDLIAEFPKIQKWRDAVLRHRASQESTVPDFESIYLISIVRWEGYIRNRALERVPHFANQISPVQGPPSNP